MSPRNKGEILYEILGWHGYRDWVVIEPNQPNGDAPYILCNFIARRKAEVAIPEGCLKIRAPTTQSEN